MSATAIVDQRWFYRMLEIFPGAVSWAFLALPVILSLVDPLLVAYFIIGFDLYWLIKSIRLSTYLVMGYRQMHKTEGINWLERLDWLERPGHHLEDVGRRLVQWRDQHPTAARRVHLTRSGRACHREYQRLLADQRQLRSILAFKTSTLKPSEVYNAVILTTLSEAYEVMESSIEELIKGSYPLKQIIFILAYEERGGAKTRQSAARIVQNYGHYFGHVMAIMHPDGIEGELKGKGANMTCAGRKLGQYVLENGIDPEKVIVTTLDADHRPGRQYFSNLTYAYCLDTKRVNKSYQPIPMFNNNIWDVPAPMRVIATGNSFWMIMETMRPHRLRNFAAHAQSLKALITTDYWSVTTPVEDGHQYWRSYFAFAGDYRVEPIFIPIYQDAVLNDSYAKTFRAQFIQLRRWAYGASDIPFVIREGIKHRNISLASKLVQTWRLFEGHFSWATAALLITFVAWLPLTLNYEFSQQVLAHQLPIIASQLMNVALVGLVITIAISMNSLPPRPARYGRHRNVFMVLQWALLPITSIGFGSFAALNAQTRLMFGRYLGFDFTKKSRHKGSK